MAIKLNSVKCPECGATLPIEEGRTQIFCSYCGTKVIVTNENEYIYRHIDEAEVKQAETDRMIKLRELEMEEKENSFEKKKLLFIVGTVGVMILIGILGYTFDNAGMGMCLLFGMIIAEFAYIHYDGKKDKKVERSNRRAGRIQPSHSSDDLEGKDVHYVEQTLRSCGFLNVSTIPMNDLTAGIFIKPGKVEEVTIGGKTDFEDSDWFDPNSKVLITYHSMR